MNKKILIIMLGLLLETNSLYSNLKQVEGEVPPKLWGFELSSETVDAISGKKDADERNKYIRHVASLRSDNDAELNHKKSTALILLGYYQVNDSIDLIISNLDHFDRKRKAYPAKHALVAYGDTALPKIIAAFEGGLTGKKAAVAVSAVKEIKGDDFVEYTIYLKDHMSEKAFNEFLKYPAD